MLPLSENVSQVNGKRKKSYAQVAKIYGKNESYICEIVKRKKKFVLVLLSHLKLQKLWPQCVISA